MRSADDPGRDERSSRNVEQVDESVVDETASTAVVKHGDHRQHGLDDVTGSDGNGNGCDDNDDDVGEHNGGRTVTCHRIRAPVRSRSLEEIVLVG